MNTKLIIVTLTLFFIFLTEPHSASAELEVESEARQSRNLEPRELTGSLEETSVERRLAAAEDEPNLAEDGTAITPPALARLPVIDHALANRLQAVPGDETLRVIIHLAYLPHAAVFESVTSSLKADIDELETDRLAFLANQAARRDGTSKVDAENYAAMFAMDSAERQTLREIGERNEALSAIIKNQVSAQLRVLLEANQAPVIQAIAALGGNVEFTTIAANTIVATIPAWAVGELSAIPGVMRVVEDSLMEAHLDNAASATMVDPADTALSGLWDDGHNGGAYDPAIIDSGIDLSHPGMTNNADRSNFTSWYVVAGAGSSFYDETCCSIDDFTGHGTHVSGIVGSYGTAAWPTRLGMAHGVDKMVSLKAGWRNTSGTTSMFWSDKYNVVDRALYNVSGLNPGTFGDDVDGMNLSYGGATSLDDTDGGRFWDSVISTYPDLVF